QHHSTPRCFRFGRRWPFVGCVRSTHPALLFAESAINRTHSSNNRFLLLLLLLGAFASNPDEDSFRRYAEKVIQKKGGTWLEAKLLTASTLVFKRLNLWFLSIVTIENNDSVWVGVFSQWIPLPSTKRLVDIAGGKS
ncbi:hypothetical protein M427DRAFT_64124, partial [Gonapodya prolifera JEL478]